MIPHVEVKLPIDFPAVVDGHDVRLVRPPGSVRLPEQPLPEAFVIRVVRLQQLNCHYAIHHGVFGHPHLTEPTLTQQPLQPVVAESRTRLALCGP